ncbi:MAG: DUF202 domain-containing protein [Nonomuraea sp.]|nr:DUF202 domain-containing protein [Nonomuraea sp.]
MSSEIWDPGLQSERTRLAWVRTAVALSTSGLGGGGLALRHALPLPIPLLFALATLCGGILLVRTGVRFRRVQVALHGGEPLDHGMDVLLAWIGTLGVVAGAAGFVVCVA